MRSGSMTTSAARAAPSANCVAVCRKAQQRELAVALLLVDDPTGRDDPAIGLQRYPIGGARPGRELLVELAVAIAGESRVRRSVCEPARHGELGELGLGVGAGGDDRPVGLCNHGVGARRLVELGEDGAVATKARVE